MFLKEVVTHPLKHQRHRHINRHSTQLSHYDYKRSDFKFYFKSHMVQTYNISSNELVQATYKINNKYNS